MGSSPSLIILIIIFKWSYSNSVFAHHHHCCCVSVFWQSMPNTFNKWQIFIREIS
jgi:hypothetical protein